KGVRTALLLQYAAASAPVRAPKSVGWPIVYHDDLLPPVLVVSGRATAGVNAVALPPDRGEGVVNDVYPLPSGAARSTVRWASHPHFDGGTPNADAMESHSSVLAPGERPHPLHRHEEEEILIVVEGEADAVLADAGDGRGERRERLG